MAHLFVLFRCHNSCIQEIFYSSTRQSIYLVQGTKRSVSRQPIYEAFGHLKTSALPELHSLSGCNRDTAGSFPYRGKKRLGGELSNLPLIMFFSPWLILVRNQMFHMKCWPFQKCLYAKCGPKTLLMDIGNVRWWLFTKKQFHDEHLPTRGALQPATCKQ